MQINAECKQLKFQMLAEEQSYENNVQSSTSWSKLQEQTNIVKSPLTFTENNLYCNCLPTVKIWHFNTATSFKLKFDDNIANENSGKITAHVLAFVEYIPSGEAKWELGRQRI